MAFFPPMDLRARPKQFLFVAIFFLSGIAGLGYQIIWARSFAASVGHEYAAMLAVVTAFMSGMAVGNALLARGSSKWLNPRTYGWLEIAIGFWAVAIVALTPFVQSVVFSLLDTSSSPALQWTVIFVAVFLTLLPATGAMGATLPAAEIFLRTTTARQTVGLLYGTNTAGAALGALLSAFWLLPDLGLAKSSFALAIVNLFCGCAALLFARSPQEPAAIAPASSQPASTIAPLLFISGLLGIGLEVTFVRALSHILENTIFTFAVVLAVYLVGTALGAHLFHCLPERRRLTLPSLFLLLALASTASGILLRWIPKLYNSLRFSFGDSLAQVAIAETLVTLALLFLPTLVMGHIWALLAQRSLASRSNLAWAVAINTAGAALGPILFGLLIIPLGGLKTALVAVPVGYALLAGKNRLALAGLTASLAAAPLMTSTRHLIDSGSTVARVISLSEDVMGSVAVIENPDSSRVLKFNNRFQMGGTAAAIAEERQAHIPLLLQGSPRKALFIGLGTGITFTTASHYPELKSDGVELVRAIAHAMSFFNPPSTLLHPNLKVHVADGRRFVRESTDHYDVIVADLFHPAQDGAAFLYTQEHFRALSDRLTPDGLVCQWLPLHQLSTDTFEIIAQTFRSVFPNAQLWLLRFNAETPVVGLIASRREGYDPRMIDQLYSEGSILSAQLRKTGLPDAVRLLGCYIGPISSAPSLPNSNSKLRLNTDTDPLVLFRAPALTFQRDDEPAHRLAEIVKRYGASAADLPLIAGPSTPEIRSRLQRFFGARNRYLDGLVAESKGELPAAIAAFVDSARLTSDFTAGYARALTIATSAAKSQPSVATSILQQLIDAQPNNPVAAEILRRLDSGN